MKRAISEATWGAAGQDPELAARIRAATETELAPNAAERQKAEADKAVADAANADAITAEQQALQPSD